MTFALGQPGHLAEHDLLASTPFILSRFDGAAGDGATDNANAMLNVLDAAGEWADAEGRAEVVIPPGVWNCSQRLYVPPGVTLVNHGRVRFTGANNVGGFIRLQEANCGATGGVWDSNGVGNTNTFEIHGDAENIRLWGARIENAPHGGAHIPDVNDPADVGRGGGKGITVQFGGHAVFLHDLLVDNCDLGISIEARGDDPTGYTRGVIMSDVVITNARYMGLYLTGNYQQGNYSGWQSALLSNIELVDCAIGQTGESSPQDIADLFGVITCSAAVGFNTSNIVVRTTEGKATVLRGSWRHCNWDIRGVIGGDLGHGFDSARHGGYQPSDSPPRRGTVDLKLAVHGTIEGYLFNSDGTYPPAGVRMMADITSYSEGQSVTTSTSKYASSLPSSCHLTVFDGNSGDLTVA